MAGEDNITSLGATALSAGAGFLGSIAGSVGGGLFSANQARKNRAFQERMYNKQVEDTIKFWNMQNEYNLPSAAYARELEGMRVNGINPMLMYGNGVSQSVSTGQPQLPSAPHGAQGSVGSFHTPIDMANLALLDAEVENKKASSALMRTEAGESASRTEMNSFDLAFKKDTAEINKSLLISQYDLNKSMEALSREQRYYYRDECKKIGAEVDSIISDMKNKTAKTAAEINDINVRLNKFLEQFPHLIANLDSQTRLNYANALAASVAARYQQELIDSGYIDILVGKEGQDLLNAIKYGDQLTIENGLKALEFQSRPKAGSWMYKARNFMEYVGKPAVDILQDAAIGAGALYMLKGAKVPFKVKGFAP